MALMLGVAWEKWSCWSQDKSEEDNMAHGFILQQGQGSHLVGGEGAARMGTIPG